MTGPRACTLPLATSVLIPALVAIGCDRSTASVSSTSLQPVTAEAAQSTSPPATPPKVTASPDVAAPAAAAAVATTQLAKPDAASAAAKAPAKAPAPDRPRMLAAAPGKPREITFDTIKFEMQKGDPFLRSMLTPQIESLDGKPIRIRGYILPSFQQSGITQFVLVRDNLQCCFGPGAALFDCIVVDMRPGRSTEYSTRPVSVTGTFSVRELLDPDGKHLAIYHLDGDAVQ